MLAVRWLTLWISVVLLGVAAPASVADPFAVDVPGSLVTPVLMGDSVAWAEGTVDGGAVVDGIDATGQVRELARLPGVEGLKVTVAASSQLLVVRERAQTCVGEGCKYGVYDVHADAVLAGRVGSPLDCVTGFT